MPQALQFVKQLGEALHSISSKSSTRNHLELIYVIPAPRMEGPNNQDFGPKDLLQLADSVDGFSLMTYDFSGPQNPGPSAPLKWIQYSLTTLLPAKGSASQGHSHMIFLGINFYGNDFLLFKGTYTHFHTLAIEMTESLFTWPCETERSPMLCWYPVLLEMLLIDPYYDITLKIQ